MKKLMNVAIVLVVGLMFFTGCGLGNPSVAAEQVAYVTNEPFTIGEKGEFLEIMIGPTSYGLGWRNKVTRVTSYTPMTFKENFAQGKPDSRILSKDKINMEVGVSVILGHRYSPVSNNYNENKFKENMRMYFEGYTTCWADRYKEPFRTKIRNLLGKESYGSAKIKRVELSGILKKYIDSVLSPTPIYALAVNVSNINPPFRMLEEQELMKATEIAEQRQAIENKLQQSKAHVMKTEAQNLARALRINSKYLQWKELEVKNKYADGFKTLITGEEAKSINKVLLAPYGTPMTLNPQ